MLGICLPTVPPSKTFPLGAVLRLFFFFFGQSCSILAHKHHPHLPIQTTFKVLDLGSKSKRTCKAKLVSSNLSQSSKLMVVKFGTVYLQIRVEDYSVTLALLTHVRVGEGGGAGVSSLPFLLSSPAFLLFFVLLRGRLTTLVTEKDSTEMSNCYP